MATRRFNAVGRQKAARRRNACVVDDQRRVLGQRGDGGHVIGVGHVQLDRLDARQRDAGRVARGGIDLAGSAGQRLAGEGQAQAAIGPGDEYDGVLEFHDAYSLVRQLCGV
ncbi:hypothetical protein D3C72_1977180 [compost metagenome]